MICAKLPFPLVCSYLFTLAWTAALPSTETTDNAVQYSHKYVERATDQPPTNQISTPSDDRTLPNTYLALNGSDPAPNGRVVCVRSIGEVVIDTSAFLRVTDKAISSLSQMREYEEIQLSLSFMTREGATLLLQQQSVGLRPAFTYNLAIQLVRKAAELSDGGVRKNVTANLYWEESETSRRPMAELKIIKSIGEDSSDGVYS